MKILDAVKLLKHLLSRKEPPPMLAIGTAAPDFTVQTHEGQSLTLSDLRGQKVLLWFYPKADTPG